MIKLFFTLLCIPIYIYTSASAPKQTAAAKMLTDLSEPTQTVPLKKPAYAPACPSPIITFLDPQSIPPLEDLNTSTALLVTPSQREAVVDFVTLANTYDARDKTYNYLEQLSVVLDQLYGIKEPTQIKPSEASIVDKQIYVTTCNTIIDCLTKEYCPTFYTHWINRLEQDEPNLEEDNRDDKMSELDKINKLNKKFTCQLAQMCLNHDYSKKR